MRLSLLLAFLVSSTVALAADRQINQISVEQSDSQTIIRLFGSDLIRSPKDRVFFAAEASSYSLEPMMMYGDSEYVEVTLGMPVMAGQYRISIGPNENTSTLESMVVIGAIGPQGPAGRDGADGRDGVDGLDGAPGADGKDGMDGADGVDGAKGDPGGDGADGSSCTVTQTATGANLSCTDGTMASVANGLNGDNGRDSVDGINGVNGQDGADGQNGVDGSSCSVEEIDGGAVVSCTDGTSAVLAGAGTDVFVRDINQLNAEVVLIPTGEILLIDANEKPLGEVVLSRNSQQTKISLAFELEDGIQEATIEVIDINNEYSPYFGTQSGLVSPSGKLLYLTENCEGLPFGSSAPMILTDLVDVRTYQFWVHDTTRTPSKILFKSSRKSSAGANPDRVQCDNTPVVETASPMIEAYLPSLQSAISPLRLRQLP